MKMGERTGQLGFIGESYYAICIDEDGKIVREVRAKSKQDAYERIEYWCTAGMIEENW
jgi:hypothetical protein